MPTITVQGAPNLYVCEDGALEKVKEAIHGQQFNKGLMITGTKSWKAAKEYIEPLELNVTKTFYNGECSKEEVQRLSELSNRENVDYIFGVGGGKVLDLAKATAHMLHIPFVLVPTLASNCAPWTPLSVFYDNEGNFLNYEVFPNNAFMVAVDPNIIIRSPEDYLRAGIGDTIAKWYEAEVLVRELSVKPLAVEISLHAAKLSHDVLIEEGQGAMKALRDQSVTSSFVRVIETIIMAGGMVGGFGDHYGRIAGAHSVHNGLTTVPETHQYHHGDKVAYGILVQLAVENRYDEIDKLLPYFTSLKLPVSLKDLGIEENLDSVYKQIATASTKEGESIHLMEVSTQEAVETAIKELETFIFHEKGFK